MCWDEKQSSTCDINSTHSVHHVDVRGSPPVAKRTLLILLLIFDDIRDLEFIHEFQSLICKMKTVEVTYQVAAINRIIS